MRLSESIRTKYTVLPAAALAAMVAWAPASSAAGGEVIPGQGVCNVSFQLMDENDDAMIDNAEASAAQDEVFGYLDLNNDGVITNYEYQQCITGPVAAQDVYFLYRTKANFAPVDIDNDGKVSRAEYMMFARKRYEAGMKASGGKVSAETYAEMMKGLSTSYTGADRNKDGYISAAEAAADIDYTYYSLDTDADGSLTFSEWRTANSPRYTAARNSFNKIDTNGDGDISKDEYAAYWTVTHKGLAENPVPVWEYRAERYYMR